MDHAVQQWWEMKSLLAQPLALDHAVQQWWEMKSLMAQNPRALHQFLASLTMALNKAVSHLHLASIHCRPLALDHTVQQWWEMKSLLAQPLALDHAVQQWWEMKSLMAQTPRALHKFLASLTMALNEAVSH